MTQEEARECAEIELFGREAEDVVKVDPQGNVMFNHDGSAYVQAWIYVDAGWEGTLKSGTSF